MTITSKNYQEKKFPRERILITDPLDAAKKKNKVCGVWEIEVSKFKKESKENNVSFLSRIIFAVARAAEKNPIVNSYKKGRNKIIEFHEADICVVVEREINSIKLPLPYIIRKANLKTIQEIDGELKNAKNGNINEIYFHNHMKFYLALPKFIRVLFWKFMFRNPHQFKKNLGTIAITALHSKGYGLVHFDPISPYTLTLALGRISKNNKGEDIMSITLSMDHDILDGMDLIKFVATLTKS